MQVRFSTEFEARMSSYERLDEYRHLAVEGTPAMEGDPPVELWPSVRHSASPAFLLCLVVHSYLMFS
jgi:hypothetical protein